MTPEQFAYWLQGFVELTNGQALTHAQWQSIKEHLAQVFTKVTPPLAKTPSEQAALQRLTDLLDLSEARSKRPVQHCFPGRIC